MNREPSATLPRPKPVQPVADAPPRRKFLAVVNPVSGPRTVKAPRKELEERARKLDIQMDIVETTPERNGTETALSAQGPYDCFLVWGGDGTVMEVASAAIREKVPLAIIPRGTANAVAWHFGIPFDVARALQVALRGEVVEIDVAHTRHQDFLIMAGLGFDARIIAGATRSLKRRFGFLAYLFGAARNFGQQPYTFRVSLDGREPFRMRGVSAAITNLGTLAGNVRPVRPVSPQDGVLDLIVVSHANFADFFRLVFGSLLGKLHEDPRVRHFQAARVRVETRPLAPLQIDGDEIKGMHRDLEVEILARALQVVVPPEWMVKIPWLPDVPFSAPGINTPPPSSGSGRKSKDWGDQAEKAT